MSLLANDAHYVDDLTAIKQNGRYRQRVFTQIHDKFIHICQHALINFSGNDYLGLSQHVEVKKKAQQAIDRYGVGSTSSAIVSGSHYLIESLEHDMAAFVDYPRALLFNSGYHANLAVMSLIGKNAQTVVADKLVHASILDGIALSGAKLKRYPHQNIDSLYATLQKHPEAKYVISEGIFSMDGDISPLARLGNMGLAKLIVDDAHGFGVLGQSGRGAVNHAGLTFEGVPIMIVPCGKALGAMGALVCASEEFIELLIQTARSYIYSTALAIPVVAALNASLKLVMKGDCLRDKLFENIAFFNQYAQKLGLHVVSHDLTPIRSIIIGDNKRTQNIQSMLKDKGFYVSCIRPPTVPQDSARLRISLTALHDTDDIKALLDQLVYVL
ncbi:8-amino-7-oxononanoate synthase [Cysteiniphilum sp. QT6929]|uniref:aminotransferase class I/II-fold pyridoxal phosphate-dependent enzyme n=1 Tax=Cysteiniphilum sp. QT6929 TaxID=2975055 RepID=UPI0024B32E3B|nr:8-amino-7-oxononanoate synthase [Cysteiniphilum sp. QT6929]WHN65786.1 8-amino-7-oxononanoate synthase [Cysteiniphilum sp. QT6929]